MRILIIGGTSFIGPRVARRLAEAGHAVTVFHRGTSGTDRPVGVIHLRGDRDDLPQHRDAIGRVDPDVVIDMIAMTQRHAEGLIEAVSGIARRAVVISSADVYRNYGGLLGIEEAPPAQAPLDEDAPLRSQLYPYRGREEMASFKHRDEYDKIVVERTLLTQHDLPTTVLRLPAVYGPDDRQHRTWGHLRAMDDGRPAIILGNAQGGWRWSRGYVENVAGAICAVALEETALQTVYNVADEPPLTEAQWAAAIGQAAGWRGVVRQVAEEDLPLSLKPPYRWEYSLALDTRRLRRDFPIADECDLATSLSATVQWERGCPRSEEPADYAAEDEVLARLTAEDYR